MRDLPAAIFADQSDRIRGICLGCTFRSDRREPLDRVRIALDEIIDPARLYLNDGNPVVAPVATVRAWTCRVNNENLMSLRLLRRHRGFDAVPAPFQDSSACS